MPSSGEPAAAANAADGERTPSPKRLGLALSGGGLRAAFFHAGVLARMGDLDLLRHVRVLSTVSGGSIVGTLYYLHLQQRCRDKEGPPTSMDSTKTIFGTS